MNMKKNNISKYFMSLFWVIVAFISFTFGFFKIEEVDHRLVAGTFCIYFAKIFLDLAQDEWENCK
jgi:uncharacterized protein (UPF0333 family)